MSKITCRWLEKSRMVVNPDGQVHPCCYFANFHYMNKHQNPEGYKHFFETHPDQSLMAEYDRNKDDLNINNKSMKEILTHEWYDQSLPNSWKEQNTRHEICIRFCQHEE